MTLYRINKRSESIRLNPNALFMHLTRSFSLSYVLKTKFDYAELVERRKKAVDLDNTIALYKLAPKMVEKLKSGEKLDDKEIRLAEGAGIRIVNGTPVPQDSSLLEYFAEDKESKRELQREFAENEKVMEKMTKDKSDDNTPNPPSSSSGPSNYQDSSDITGDGDDMDYFGDI